MKLITKDAAIERLRRDGERGGKVKAVIKDAEAADAAYLIEFKDAASVLSLIFHDVPETKILTPVPEERRTLQDVVARMRENGHSIESLARGEPKGGAFKQPWFEKCSKILSEPFSFEKLGVLTLWLPKEKEQEQSPDGSLYLRDGSHRGLALAWWLLVEGREFRAPVEGILLLPRPETLGRAEA